VLVPMQHRVMVVVGVVLGRDRIRWVAFRVAQASRLALADVALNRMGYITICAQVYLSFPGTGPETPSTRGITRSSPQPDFS
jgi:hypothetical protein